jgi:hypothetical protein
LYSTRSNEVSPKDDEFRSGTTGGDDLSISDLIYKVSDSRRIYYRKAFCKKENLSNGHALSILDGTTYSRYMYLIMYLECIPHVS